MRRPLPDCPWSMAQTWQHRLFAHWALQPVEADIRQETTVRLHGLTLPDQPPLLHDAHSLDALA